MNKSLKEGSIKFIFSETEIDDYITGTPEYINAYNLSKQQIKHSEMARNATENLAAWKLLLSLAQGGGISEAAVAAGMDIAACSRLLRRLEEELGFKLIDHFSRPAKLTQEAVSILPAVESFAESFDRLQSVCRACRSIPFSVNLGIPVNVPRRGLFAVIKSYEKIDPAMLKRIVAAASIAIALIKLIL